LGNKETGNTNKILFLKTDSKFNVLFRKCYSLPKERHRPSVSVFKNKKGNFILYGALGSTLPNNLGAFPFLLEISDTGELIYEQHITGEKRADLIFDIIEKKDKNGYFVVSRFYPEYNSLQGKIYSLNNKLEFLSYISIPESIHNASTLKWYSDTTFIVSGVKNPNKQDDEIGLIVMDTLGTKIYSKNFGKPSISDFPAFFCNFDYSLDSSSFYIVGTSGFQYYSYPTVNSSIFLTKADKDLNVLWEKFYGGDAYYNVFNVQTTSDGGCIIISARYDEQTQNYENDIHILKVDSEGNLQTGIENEVITESEMLIYPNPGAEELHIRTAIQSLEGVFCLYDISGKLIINQQITETETQINTSDLSKGTYIYRYQRDGKTIENGKWLKK
jgi:hypothetical protein